MNIEEIESLVVDLETALDTAKIVRFYLVAEDYETLENHYKHDVTLLQDLSKFFERDGVEEA